MVKTAGSIFSPNISGPIKRRIRTKYPPAVPLAHYKLDGDANDASGNGHHGTPTGISYVTGKIGQAALFNGSAHITLPPTLPYSENSYTFLAWIRSTAEPADQDVIFTERFNYGINRGHSLLLSSDKLRAYHGNSSLIGINLINPNVDTHVGVSYDGTNVTLWINGEVDRTSTLPATAAYSTNIYLGAEGGIANYFWGRMDEVQIYNEALPIRTIRAIYNNRG